MGALRFPGFGERLEAAMIAAGYVTDEGKPDVPGFIERFRFDPRNFYPWLRGKRTPELPTLTRLAEILGVSRSWLLLGDGPPPDRVRPARRRRMPAPITGGSANGPSPTGDIMFVWARRFHAWWGWLHSWSPMPMPAPLHA